VTIDLLYDFLQVRGGAEQVSLALAQALQATLRVHAIDPSAFPERAMDRAVAIDHRPLSHSRLVRAGRAWRGFRRLPRSDADGVIFSGHFAPLGWRAYPQARRLLYLHGPPIPFCFDPSDPGLRTLSLPIRQALKPVFSLLVRQFIEAAEQMHVVLANSVFTARAFERATGRRALVLQPPVAECFFERPEPDAGHWISLARHEPMKRVDRIIAAFADLPHLQLVVAGSGSCTDSLIRQAEGLANVRFVGTLGSAELARWLRSARASIHLSRAEPFGLAVAESLAAGIPVLATNEGGMAELISADCAGRLVGADPDIATLRDAIAHFPVRRDSGDGNGRVSSCVAHLRMKYFEAAMRGALSGEGESSSGTERANAAGGYR
jgi:glycosyltransferase involved in cell wall biosynthesis